MPHLIAQTGVDPADVIGVGIDFTACTMLPTTADGTPLCMIPEYRRRPHAWVKLWKHHAAQPEADRINAVARARGEPWLPRYGGKISSEWFYSKSLQILDEDPELYRAADRLIEATDWVVWRLTGVETRNSCTAGYKAIWSKADGFPAADYFADLDPRFAAVVDDKMSRDIAADRPAGGRADAGGRGMDRPPSRDRGGRGQCRRARVRAGGDGHPARPHGGGHGHEHLPPRRWTLVPRTVEGMCGVVEDGILPGMFGFEAGQSAVGDIFAWFIDNAVPAAYQEAAARAGIDVHAILGREAALLRPGRIRPARPRLVERQPVDPGRCRPDRPAPGGNAGDDGRRRSIAR